jgi:hypothetical protein
MTWVPWLTCTLVVVNIGSFSQFYHVMYLMTLIKKPLDDQCYFLQCHACGINVRFKWTIL